MEYDMSDIKIRVMVEAQHSPREFRLSNHSGLLAQTIECEFCYESWPCDARRQLLAWHKASAPPRNAASGEARSDADTK